MSLTDPMTKKQMDFLMQRLYTFGADIRDFDVPDFHLRFTKEEARRLFDELNSSPRLNREKVIAQLKEKL